MSLPAGGKPPLRRSLRLVVVAWVFGATWLYIVTGATLTKFAKLLELPNFWFGVLGAMMYAAQLIQLPTSYFIERYGHRKLLFIGVGVIHRAVWLLIGLLPWALPIAWQWKGLIFLVAVSWTAGQVPGPIWVSWMADLVPAPIRGRYFSRRTQIGQTVGLVVTLLMGYILDCAENRGPQMLLLTASVALAISAVMGVIDFLHFIAVPEPRQYELNPSASLLNLVRVPLRDANFRRYLLFTATLTFSIGYFNQFVWLYLFDVAKMTNTQAQALLLTVPLIVTMIFYPIWGRLIDRLGRKPVLIIAELLFVLGAVGWIFVTREHWLWGFVVVTIGTAAWPGVDAGNFNVLLRMSQVPKGQGSGVAYIAVNSGAGAIAGILSGLFGGCVASVLADWQGNFMGLAWTYHSVLFVIAAGLRIVAVAPLFRLEDAGAQSPQTALRYLGTNLYSNFQQAIFLPGRLLWQFGRWTYNLNQARPRGRRRPPPPA